MININSQEKKINITVSSGASNGNVKVTQDTAQFYSEKAREWAISNRIVDGVDYSSKYYANKSNQSALNAQSFAQSAQDNYNNVQNTAIKALDDIEADKTSAISEVNSTKSTALTDITTAKNNAVNTVNATASSLANKDLSNLSAIGEKHFLNKSQITNCLIEIPQRIKLELNNGTLTLKAGSEVTVPNGFEADGVTPKFEYIEVSEDISRTGEGTSVVALPFFVQTTDMKLGYSKQHFSGDTDPKGLSNEPYKLWYDTKNNIVKVTSDGGNTWITNGYSLPIGFITIGSQISAINQVFNGMGYIGSTVWVDKDVKGLIPNGRNEDGSLNNIEYTTSKFAIRTMASNWTFKGYEIYVTLDSSVGVDDITYNEAENYIYTYYNNAIVKAAFLVLGMQDCSNGAISNLQPKQVFKSVDYSDKSTVSGWSMPSGKVINLTLGASGTQYTAPANGWVALSKHSLQYQYIHLLHVDGFGQAAIGAGVEQDLYLTLPVSKGTKFTVSYNASGATNYFKFYYAQGDK